MRIRTTAAALCAAVLVAGCGGGGGGDSDAKATDSAAAQGSSSGSGSGSGSASAAAPEAPAEPLDEAQLKSAALVAGDVDGYQITDFPVKPDGDSTARPADCQPLENMRTASPDPGPKAFVGLLAFGGAGPTAGSATTIGLMAYDGSDAEGILDGLRTALKKCTAYEGGVPARTTAKAAAAPDAGDEAVAFGLETQGDSADAFVVVRSGATVVLFYTAAGTGSAAEVPAELVTAQIRKLGA
ncbi:hypothetical protein OG613_09230 [Streptomyces sp. NBC_00015]|uniref:hypothetical protein n=1 Tax=unclassified Streptomyces TaxID=2593676 RepID=UPI00224E4E31|nr:hypothetical protein [Streptomyces sp. NBC_00103]MCX5374392.1 hypothetical protein [Streptomyces sp. NBC_00103]